MSRHVVCTYICSAPGCGNTLVLDRDTLPPGWWRVGEDEEYCPRHKPVYLPAQVTADECYEPAVREHYLRGFELKDPDPPSEEEDKTPIEKAGAP